jgi:hypothetical protein
MKRILLILLACLTPALARAQTIDLTTLGSFYFGADGARWYQGTTFPGTVSFLPFLRVMATGTEQGFNTDFRPLPPDGVGTLASTHSVTFGSFAPRILTDATGSYRFYALFVDVNESSTSSDNYLSLDSLQVYSVPAGGGGSLSSMAAVQAAGTLRYDMDQPANQVVLMDGNLVSGSGSVDLEIDIPASRFTGVAPADFMYIWMYFGRAGTISTRKYGSSGGFEEIRYYPVPATGVEESSSASAGPWLRVLGGPFPSTARFRYFVPHAGPTRLTLYDVHGRAVASISSNSGSGGVREVPLLSLPSASRLPSGIYFYEFQWNGARQVGKVAVLK